MKYIDTYINYLKSNHYSSKTITIYKFIFRIIDRILKELNISDEKTITSKNTASLILNKIFLLKSDFIKVKCISILKIYFNYLEEEKIIFLNPFINVEVPKVVVKNFPILTKDEITEIVNKIDTSTKLGLRFRTIFELMYSSALRPMEVVNLKLTDIDYIKKILFISCSKMKKDRVVPVTTSAIYWLEKYIKEVRPGFTSNESDNYIFIYHNKLGKKLAPIAIHLLFNRAFKVFNIKKFKPYSLRPTSATHLLQNGMGTLYLKELLGHESIITTQQYLRVKHLDLKKELNLKHPRFK